MKKNTKGFTLIELLAVIVILAIIALIATPIVLNLVEKSRKGAAQDSAFALRKTAENYYFQVLMEEPGVGLTADVTFTCDGKKCAAPTGTHNLNIAKKNADGTVIADQYEDDYLDIGGTIPTEGTITVKANGDRTFSGIKYGAYVCSDESLNGQGSVTCNR